MIESQTIVLGERRKITISVHSLTKQPFEIKNATYTLLQANQIEASGVCDVEEKNPLDIYVSAIVQPKLKANYILEFHYDIDPERLIYQCMLKVVGGC